MKRVSALITGGSKGIGLAVARCFAPVLSDLHLVARGMDELEEVREELNRPGLRPYRQIICQALRGRNQFALPAGSGLQWIHVVPR